MLQRLQEDDHFDFDEFETKLLEMEEHKIERYIRRKDENWCKQKSENIMQG